jgi:hypothetical protein
MRRRLRMGSLSLLCHSIRPGCDFFYHRGQEIDVVEKTFALTVQVR